MILLHYIGGDGGCGGVSVCSRMPPSSGGTFIVTDKGMETRCMLVALSSLGTSGVRAAIKTQNFRYSNNFFSVNIPFFFHNNAWYHEHELMILKGPYSF